MSTKPVPECGVVILGGTAGVGLETAAQFAERGARVVLFVASPAARRITGQAISINGGISAA